MRILILVLAASLALLSGQNARAQELSSEVAELRQLLSQAKSDYEDRIAQLEARLARAESLARSASQAADDAVDIAEQTAIDASAGTSAPNTFNPAIGAVLISRYGDVDGGWESIPGFLPGGELGPGDSGVSLGESEVNLKASIDAHFFGNLTLALEDEDGETEVAVEEAWVQTTALGNGLTLRGGRYFSGAGYLNSFHRHADDFADRALPYQAFLGGQFVPDGVQARWVAPIDMFMEFGAELNWGSSFPASGKNETSPDSWTLFAKIGGDVGASHSWQAGFSWLSTDVLERPGGEDASESEVFSGDSDLAVVDAVWKWAPNGNSAIRNFKLQAEYFWRSEEGLFDALPYDGDQEGWYLQGIWQFMPRWRVGYRHDEVSADNGILLTGTVLGEPSFTPGRDTLMVDFSPSEFSRLRLQFTHDNVLEESADHILLQYLMSIGAHGAHQF